MLQSAEDNLPVLSADAMGMLIVMVAPAATTLTSVPVVPVTIAKGPVRPFKESTPDAPPPVESGNSTHIFVAIN
jgi:hypothetical protein